MAVDYEEGRRLDQARKDARKKWSDDLSNQALIDIGRAERAFDEWLHANAEALLNPDPWRPISELEEKHKDGRMLDLWVGDYADGGFRIPDCRWGTEYHGAEPCWMDYRPHPDAQHDWEWQPIDFVPTHLRELKGPGHV